MKKITKFFTFSVLAFFIAASLIFCGCEFGAKQGLGGEAGLTGTLADCTANINTLLDEDGNVHSDVYYGGEIKVDVSRLYFKSTNKDVDLSKCTFTYSNNINAGLATLTITSSEYSGQYVYSYQIKKAEKDYVCTGGSDDTENIVSFLENGNYSVVKCQPQKTGASVDLRMELNKNLEVPNGVQLVFVDVVLTNKKTITINGTLQIGDGTFDSALINVSGAKILNNNMLALYSKSSLYLNGGSTLENNGTIKNPQAKSVRESTIYYDDFFDGKTALLSDEKIEKNGQKSGLLSFVERSDVSKILENNLLSSLIYFEGAENSSFSNYVSTNDYISLFQYTYTGEKILPGYYDSENKIEYHLDYTVVGYYYKDNYGNIKYNQNYFLANVGEVTPLSDDLINIGRKKYKLIMSDLNTVFYGEIELEYDVNPSTLILTKFDEENDLIFENLKDKISNYDVIINENCNASLLSEMKNLNFFENAHSLTINKIYRPKNANFNTNITINSSDVYIDNTISFSETSSITLNENGAVNFSSAVSMANENSEFENLNQIKNDGTYLKGAYILKIGEQNIKLIIK